MYFGGIQIGQHCFSTLLLLLLLLLGLISFGVGGVATCQVYRNNMWHLCRETRKVKEAFRFMECVGKPSVADYNQLMAVCAAAGDVGGQAVHGVGVSGSDGDGDDE